MMLEEAKRLYKVIETVDGSCIHYIKEMCSQMSEAFPELKWSSQEYIVSVKSSNKSFKMDKSAIKV